MSDELEVIKYTLNINLNIFSFLLDMENRSTKLLTRIQVIDALKT